MKIGFVLDDSLDKPDGVQQYILALGQWLRSEGHQVQYLVGETHRQDIPHIHSLSRNIHMIFNGNKVSIPKPVNKGGLKVLLKREAFDILHVQMPYSPMLGARVIKAAPKQTAIVGTFHIVPYTTREYVATRILRLLIRKSLRRFDACISVSQPAARFARKSLKVRSRVIPNAVHISLFEQGHRHRRYDGKITVVFLGRLVERKGCIYLLKAVQELHRKHGLMNVRVIIGGRGPLEHELQQYVHQHRLGSVVHFAGFVQESDKANFLASADIAVFPSIGGESFGIVLVEAMAAGAGVVIAGNNSGYRSVLVDRKDQFVKPANTKAFAQVLHHFITNAAARKRARRWQLAQVHQYDVRHVGKQIVGIYETAIAKKR